VTSLYPGPQAAMPDRRNSNYAASYLEEKVFAQYQVRYPAELPARSLLIMESVGDALPGLGVISGLPALTLRRRRM
jgi:hypothetical protein